VRFFHDCWSIHLPMTMLNAFDYVVKGCSVLKKSYMRTLDKWHTGRDTARCCEAIQALEGFLGSEARMEVFVSVNPMPPNVLNALGR
jgi:hypothetical protein